MKTIYTNPWVSLVWVSTLDRSRSFGEIAREWNQAGPNLFSRNPEVFEEAVRLGILSRVPVVEKKRGSILNYQAEFKHYTKAYYAGEKSREIDSKIINFLDQKKVREALFSLDKVKAICFDMPMIAKEMGFVIPYLIWDRLVSFYFLEKQAKPLGITFDLAANTLPAKKDDEYPIAIGSYLRLLLPKDKKEEIYKLLESSGTLRTSKAKELEAFQKDWLTNLLSKKD